LGKNATEGLGHPLRIVPMSLLLFGGQVMPFVMLAAVAWMSPLEQLGLLAACVGVLVPRIISCGRFGQPCSSALLHPVGILLLLVIQWMALVRSLRGKPAEWKGRSYSAA